MSQRAHRCGWVAIMGPPNAGKSTLLNAALGHKVAIVTPKPQTTRNQITGILSDKNAQIIFMDTPGIHQVRGKMNRVLLQAAWQAVENADALMVVLDADLYAKKPEFLEKDIKPIRAAIATEKRPVLVAANKVDLLGDKSKLLPLLQNLAEAWPSVELFPLSSVTKTGLPELLAKVKAVLPEGASQFPEEQLSTLSVRFMTAEIIREKLFLTLRQELPYSTAVDIEQWTEEPDRGLTVINAVIYVGRATHKAMVIGRNGSNLKNVGQAARKEIAELIDSKVYLELWVKVREDWPQDLTFLHALGLGQQPG